jgi:hypothetical protein
LYLTEIQVNTVERAVLKEQLSAMAAGRNDGIDLDTPERWAVENLREPVAFFRHVELLIPSDSILYVEGINVAPEVASFYESHRATKGAVCVSRDTIFPVPEIYHVQMEPGAVDGLIEQLGKHSREKCFIHLKAYQGERLLFAFHDAFDGSDLLVSDKIALQQVQVFCDKMGASFRRERNENKRNYDVLQALLRAMENPGKVRILWPWWKRALFFWKK